MPFPPVVTYVQWIAEGGEIGEAVPSPTPIFVGFDTRLNHGNGAK